MRFKVFTSKSKFINMIFEAVEFNSETRIQEVSDTSMLFI